MHRRTRTRGRWWWGAACAALIACWALAPMLPSPAGWGAFRAHAYATGVVYFLLLGVVVCGIVARVRCWSMRTLGTAAIVALVLVMVANVLAIAVVSDALKVVLAALLGALTIRAIERPSWLIIIALVVPISDAWSVYSRHGVTRAVLDKAVTEPRWIDWPTIATPVAGVPLADVSRLGIVDVFFLALFLAGALTWRLGVRRMVVALPLSFVATMLLVYEGLQRAIPALPLLCLTFVALASAIVWRRARSARAHASHS